MKESSEEEVIKLEKEIEQLNEFYNKIQPKNKGSDFNSYGPSKKDH
jgi:hypothetical protein